MREIREAELKQYKPIFLTEEVHKILRDQKKKQQKSMARIINDLIIERYQKNE